MYRIYAFIGREQVISKLSQHFEHSHVIFLAQHVWMLPINQRLWQEIHSEEHYSGSPCPEFTRLTRKAAEIAIQLSHTEPIGYIEAEYFGGIGEQGAVVWYQGEIILEPVCSATSGAINHTLRLLGIHAAHEKDEFDTVGLGKYRDVDQWRVQGDY